MMSLFLPPPWSDRMALLYEIDHNMKEGWAMTVCARVAIECRANAHPAG